MRIEKIPPTPQVLLEFAAEGLQRLGALCERTWHDRLQVVADGPAAAALGRPGELVETELRFPTSPGNPRPRTSYFVAGHGTLAITRH